MAGLKPVGEPPRRRTQYLVFGAPAIGDEEVAAVTATLRSGWIGSGPQVIEFEQRIGALVGAPHAVALSSCTAALHLALLAAEIGPGDEVITTAMTFCATANAIVHTGATPVLVDCDRATQCIDPRQIAAAVTPRTRAIIPVHFAGRPCDMDAILEIARRHSLLVIEDAAHALGAAYGDRPVGAIGDLTCFSFYVTKNITTMEGGMVTTANGEFADRIRLLGLHGMDRDAWKRYSDDGYRHYGVHAPGFKYNMTDLQAALGLRQLERFEGWQRRRAEIWRRYDDAFADLPVDRPAPDEAGVVHAHHLYTLMVDAGRAGVSRDALLDMLHELRIGTGVHYVGVHLQPYYRSRLGCVPGDFPNASWVSERTVSLPLSAALSDEDVDDVVDAVRAVLRP